MEKTVIRYTTAPAVYDHGTTRSVAIVASDREKSVRRVEIHADHLAWQESRYGSGMHCSYTPTDYRKMVEAGIFTER